MKKEIIERLSQNFEEVVHIEQEIEYWMARDLQGLFEYSSWDNFLNVFLKSQKQHAATLSCLYIAIFAMS